MNLFASAPGWLLWLLVLLLACATVQDAVQMRISNLITGLVAVLAIAAMAFAGFPIGLWQNAAAFAVVLVLGTILFSRGAFGGGDVKLFAAVALWAGGLTAAWLVAAILIAGGLLAILILALRTAAPEHWSTHVKVLRRKAGIPYGIAIAAGTLCVILGSTPGSHRPVDPRTITTIR